MNIMTPKPILRTCVIGLLLTSTGGGIAWADVTTGTVNTVHSDLAAVDAEALPPSTGDRLAAGNEFTVSPGLYVGVDDSWDSAQGVSLEWIQWNDSHWGYGLTGGFDIWQAADGVADVPYTDYSAIVVDGSTRTYQIGILGAYRRPMGEKHWLLARAGLSYLMSDSATRMRTAYHDYFDRDVAYEIYLENIACGLGSAGLALRRDAAWGRTRFHVQVGVEMQMVIFGDEPEWLGEDAGLGFDAVGVRLGIGAEL